MLIDHGPPQGRHYDDAAASAWLKSENLALGGAPLLTAVYRLVKAREASYL